MRRMSIKSTVHVDILKYARRWRAKATANASHRATKSSCSKMTGRSTDTSCDGLAASLSTAALTARASRSSGAPDDPNAPVRAGTVSHRIEPSCVVVIPKSAAAHTSNTENSQLAQPSSSRGLRWTDGWPYKGPSRETSAQSSTRIRSNRRTSRATGTEQSQSTRSICRQTDALHHREMSASATSAGRETSVHVSSRRLSRALDNATCDISAVTRQRHAQLRSLAAHEAMWQSRHRDSDLS